MITISKVLQATKEFIKVLRYGISDVNTPEQALPFGVDSKPVKNKRAIVLSTQRKGKNVVVGYLLQSDLVDSGEIRLYATDDDLIEQFYLKLVKDGTCEIGGDTDNMVRYSELESAFNELKNDFNTLVSNYNAHVHTGVTTGTGSSLSTPTQATQSTADISGSKIDEIKTL